jgi:hypothetical protein
VAALCRQDERFRQLRAEVHGRTVHLRGTAARWEDVHDLARRISRLPGVDRVALEDIRAD